MKWKERNRIRKLKKRSRKFELCEQGCSRGKILFGSDSYDKNDKVVRDGQQQQVAQALQEGLEIRHGSLHVHLRQRPRFCKGSAYREGRRATVYQSTTRKSDVT